jgi:hypothetical protein
LAHELHPIFLLNSLANEQDVRRLPKVANFWHRAPSHFNDDNLCRLIVNSVSEGAQCAPNITVSVKASSTCQIQVNCQVSFWCVAFWGSSNCSNNFIYWTPWPRLNVDCYS